MSSTSISAVRIRLVWTDAGDKDERLDNQIMIDLLIDRVTKSNVGTRPAFGLYGSPVREECYPFVLRADGAVDLGAFAEGERFERFNIREKRIEIGEIATYTATDGDEWCCRIVEVTELGGVLT